MTKRHESKYKIERRLGQQLWGSARSPLVRGVKTRPGQHGSRSFKMSGYGIQLTAKQKLKGYYGNLSEKQFRRYYKEAIRKKGDSSENLIGLLESRLDAIVYRAKFVATVFAARQFVNHGHVLVNGKRVNIPSYLVKPNDVITLSDPAKQFTFVQVALSNNDRNVPEYIEVNADKFSAVYKRVPQFTEVPYASKMEPNLVIEFYSR